jgi:hypothetical protein
VSTSKQLARESKLLALFGCGDAQFTSWLKNARKSGRTGANSAASCSARLANWERKLLSEEKAAKSQNGSCGLTLSFAAVIVQQRLLQQLDFPRVMLIDVVN